MQMKPSDRQAFELTLSGHRIDGANTELSPYVCLLALDDGCLLAISSKTPLRYETGQLSNPVVIIERPEYLEPEPQPSADFTMGGDKPPEPESAEPTAEPTEPSPPKGNRGRRVARGPGDRPQPGESRGPVGPPEGQGDEGKGKKKGHD